MDEEMEQLEEQEKPLQEFPLLMSEPAWNPAKERQKTIEIAMEEWGVPAFFLAKNGQLAAYVVVCLMLERFADNLQILTKQGNSSCR
jgi:actin-related protein